MVIGAIFEIPKYFSNSSGLQVQFKQWRMHKPHKLTVFEIINYPIQYLYPKNLPHTLWKFPREYLRLFSAKQHLCSKYTV